MKTKFVKGNPVSPIELSQRLNKTPVLSSRQLGWNGILVEQYQNSPTPGEVELPALSDHWLKLHQGYPVHLTQKCGDRLHESTVQQGDSIFVPAEQPTYWRCQGGDTYRATLHIYLKPKLLVQVAAASEIEWDRFGIVNCCPQPDLHLLHIATLLLAELKSGGMMGQLYVESLTQVLVIHLLRHYSTCTPTTTYKHSKLTPAQLQQAIDYIHTHLDQDLSLVQLAGVINISPTYFASLFKRATGLPPHQYVIQQRVEQAKLLLTTTDLTISNIASQVGFSSQSHLTQQFRRLTQMTPKQAR